MHRVSCTNTDHGVTDLVNRRMVKIKKLNTLRTNHNFLLNKKILTCASDDDFDKLSLCRRGNL